MSRRISFTAAEAKQLMIILSNQLVQQQQLFDVAVAEGEKYKQRVGEFDESKAGWIEVIQKRNASIKELEQTLKLRDAQIDYLQKEVKELKEKGPLQRIFGV